MTPELSAQEIRSLLRRLGVTEHYAGFSCTVCAVQLSLEDPARLRLITKRIYPDVARRCHTTSQRVERNIRTVSGTAWDKNRPLLLELAGFPLARRPNNASFLAILMGACVDSG